MLELMLSLPMPKKLILFSEKSSLTLSTKNSSVIIPYLYQTNIAEFLVTTTVAGYFAHIVFNNIFIFGGKLLPIAYQSGHNLSLSGLCNLQTMIIII